LGEKAGNDFIMVQMNLEKNLRKEIQKKMEKGHALPGQPRLPFGPESGPACFPLPLSPARGRLPRPSQRRPRGGRTPARSAPRPATSTPWSGHRPGLPGHSIHPVAGAPLAPRSTREHNRSRRAPPQRHRRSSSAAHRRPLQCPNLDARTTSTLAVVSVSFCERSTEVRTRRAP